MSPTGTDPARGPLAPASAATAATGHAMPPQAKVGALSRRIAVATVALTGGAVGIAALVLWTVAHWVLLETIDARLHGRQAHFMADRFAEHQNGHDHPPGPPGGPGFPPPGDHGPGGSGPQGLQPPRPGGPELPTVWVILRDGDTGRELWRSPNLSDQADIATALGALTIANDQPTWMTVGERDLRIATFAIDVPPPDATAAAAGPEPAGPPGSGHGQGPSDAAQGPGNAGPNGHDDNFPPVKILSVRVAVDGTSTARELMHLAWMLVTLWSTAVLLATLASWWLRRAILRPVHQLADAIRAVDPEHLPDRFPVLAVPVEMAVVQQRLDDLLVRLRQVREREKGTIADIAHELRTPIAGLRTTLEFAAFEPGAGDLAGRCLPTVLAMQSLVANLLTMTRIEAGQETVQVATVDLARVVRDAWSALAPVAAGRGTTVMVAGDDDANARTCADHARLVMANLLDNAVSHAPPGSQVTVTIARSGEFTAVSIANQTTAPAPDPANLFQPFWRGDAARSGGGLHCGLGLALCRRVMALLGGTISADIARAGWFRIEVRFPQH